MKRRILGTAPIYFWVGLMLLFFLFGAASVEEIQKVFVTNFPRVQPVSGEISVEGTIRHAVPRRFKDIVVPPVSPSDVSRLISAGTLEVDGFTSVVLGLNGYSKGKALKPGVVGAILLPDEDLVLRAFEEEGKSQFPIEIRTAAFAPSSPYSASDQQRFLVGFPRYRIWLYNTTDTSVSANLFVYLTN
ncbi:MAG: hypothetical protein L0Z52_05680 [Acidobacteria bacterium]|nr:hypothetical protein [Acidobacteriota bacterium]